MQHRNVSTVCTANKWSYLSSRTVMPTPLSGNVRSVQYVLAPSTRNLSFPYIEVVSHLLFEPCRKIIAQLQKGENRSAGFKGRITFR